MKWMEVTPLPAKCRSCQEEDCYNCDTSGERWLLSRKEELQLRRRCLLKAIERLSKQVRTIDEELLALDDFPKKQS